MTERDFNKNSTTQLFGNGFAAPLISQRVATADGSAYLAWEVTDPETPPLLNNST